MKREMSDMLCAIGDTERAHSLAEHARVMCGRCGAKSHDVANVCDPVQFPSLGTLGDERTG
ncbi:MAG: hypothetical protein ED859_04085 [Desulfuromonadales bacterium]|nr:MAG: hypothetical protein ED859_04085 [Desulfuromonadales bacterium]